MREKREEPAGCDESLALVSRHSSLLRGSVVNSHSTRRWLVHRRTKGTTLWQMHLGKRVCVKKVGGCSREQFKSLTRRRGGEKKRSRKEVRISSRPLRASAPSRETRGPLNFGAS